MANHSRFTPGILKKARWHIQDNQVTPESVFKARRHIVKAMGLGAIGASISGYVQAGLFDLFGEQPQTSFITTPLTFEANARFGQDEVRTPFDKVTTHNNFYEFGTSKQDPSDNAQQYKVEPWQLRIEGEVERPITLDYQDLTKLFPLEERIYRLRCVEAWSMVIPWVGFPLAALLKKVGVTSKGKYVAFETAFDPEQMPGQKSRLMGGGIHYPYVEGLTIAEAMNELTLMSVGLYGKTLPPQNGAPIRLVVPWKYGFKSIKSIVRIRVMDKQPPTSWNQLAPHEYGFYANVNPAVDHPRWSQASERRIGEGGLFSAQRIDTLPFNGYSEFVASLYEGMDLRQFY
ncbi:protein-methionine-sulfoxide reductase catalytic subunit MsrP [Shewanella oneidensis MR-1]|uniref:Protein-methionine-sulfoxide reductase catalytic subunit MsrP n=1 Tax=Shewanella oneidensis (strain ATCC 700550 / JCM 31522 / CIP 106686 / LMG 19005 / NCIMB 14063 / MR-1) TaxID=211586 RepID=Q8EFD9_SHEON|nr:protein-methionine-sulfoxide reductase catalytic subunit MsrP [Shewanella oneidensis]AAN55089.1 oxidoreductase molybdenum-binding subunit YedY [Shewanella oneidensis MR-1]MDX5996213.1 protein-methionine-sulfoxide reductase catalytic subunit MsrP [Shewanella oneidensis]MEE2029457.1 Protein-methionine-sulfoxide reductase catalytic subunit MsrP [Shewanella oneidensis]QKG96663.1 protein-methionine-sulfoxide reductase catalytic subunit MsrP [Shewanella oneidensis MR-1]